MRATEISKKIQPKVCKVITEYGEGSGIIIDDKNGIVLTSFHLIGFLQKARHFDIQEFFGLPDLQIKLSVFFALQHHGYLDKKFRLTEKAFSDALTENFAVKLSSQEKKRKFTMADNENQATRIEASLNDGEKWLSVDQNLRFMYELIAYVRDRSEIVFDASKIRVIYKDLEIKSGIFHGDQKNLDSVLRNSAYHDAILIKLLEFEDGLSYGFGGKIIDSGEPIAFLPENFPLEIGADIYFAGYPLRQNQYTFSRGMLSSAIHDQKVDRIIIEAPVTPGNSGGAVFLVDEISNKIFILGVISSEVAHITEELLNLREHFDKTKDSRGPMSISGRDLVGEQTRSFHEVVEFLLKNTSTGKAKVTRIFDCSQQLLTEDFIDDDDLKRCSIEFFLPKRKGKGVVVFQKEKLYEFINNRRLMRLCKEDMIDYLNSNADEKTRQTIYANLSSLNKLDNKSYIDIGVTGAIFPMQQNIPVSVLSIVVPPADPRSKQSLDPKASVALMKQFYVHLLQVSSGKIAHGEIVHVNSEYVESQSNSYITQEFYRDHIDLANPYATELKGGAITVSTVIAGNDIDGLNKEIEASQFFYAKVYEFVANLALQSEKILSSVYFITLGTYQMYINHKNHGDCRKKIPFFYSVCFKNNSYLLHHFAGCVKKESWQEAPYQDESGSRPFCYEFKS